MAAIDNRSAHTESADAELLSHNEDIPGVSLTAVLSEIGNEVRMVASKDGLWWIKALISDLQNLGDVIRGVGVVREISCRI